MNNKTTIHVIAGYCSEEVLWKLLVDLTSVMKDERTREWKVLMPDMVIVDGDDFTLDSETTEVVREFYPPEGIDNYGESGYVWSLGAMVCYASSGHYVFGGRGGTYQHANPGVELPTLRKEHSSLTPLMRRCLCYSHAQRVGIKELNTLAVKGLESVRQMSRQKQTIVLASEKRTAQSDDDDWPERMI